MPEIKCFFYTQNQRKRGKQKGREGRRLGYKVGVQAKVTTSSTKRATFGFLGYDFAEFEKYADVQSWNDAKLNGEIRNWIYVFDKDGETVIGKYIDYNIIDEDGDPVPISFVTNEMLLTGEYDNYIHNGDDAEEYDLNVKQRGNAHN